jgi:4'-phosphopantetheinyl transferase
MEHDLRCNRSRSRYAWPYLYVATFRYTLGALLFPNGPIFSRTEWFNIMLELAHGQVDLWSCNYLEIHSETLLRQYWALLTDAERQQQLRFRFPADQRRYLVTRALLRTVLSRYAEVAPAQWTFLSNAYGKPEISNQQDACRHLSFNLSHTDGLILLAVGAGIKIGVDTENVSVREAPMDIAASYLATEEVSGLYKFQPDLQRDRFFSYWTLKESYIKARGIGLSIPLDRFSFSISEQSGIDVSFTSPIEERAENWQFTQFWPSSDNIAALCTERVGEVRRDAEIGIRETVPLQGDKLVRVQVLRQSV